MSGQTLGGHGTARMPAGLPDHSARDRDAGVKLAQHAIDVGTVDDLAEVLGAMGLLGLAPKPSHSQRIAAAVPAKKAAPKRGARITSGPIPHGTHNGYTNYACRCDDCKQGHRDYRLNRQGAQS